MGIFSVKNSTDFKNKISEVIVDEDETMLSFDVFSLFTSIPVDKACEHVRKTLECDTTLHYRTKLNVDVISYNYYVTRFPTFTSHTKVLRTNKFVFVLWEVQ